MPDLTHLDSHGNAVMVDVSQKDITARLAVARGEIHLNQQTINLISQKAFKKGDVLSIAQLAGIMGAKQTSNLIPLCHPLGLTSVKVNLEINTEKNCIEIEARCKVTGKTGVEMEALVAVSVASLTVYDMIKAVDKTPTITNIRLIHKEGGKSGIFRAE